MAHPKLRILEKTLFAFSSLTLSLYFIRSTYEFIKLYNVGGYFLKYNKDYSVTDTYSKDSANYQNWYYKRVEDIAYKSGIYTNKVFDKNSNFKRLLDHIYNSHDDGKSHYINFDNKYYSLSQDKNPNDMGYNIRNDHFFGELNGKFWIASNTICAMLSFANGIVNIFSEKFKPSIKYSLLSSICVFAVLSHLIKYPDIRHKIFKEKDLSYLDLLSAEEFLARDKFMKWQYPKVQEKDYPVKLDGYAQSKSNNKSAETESIEDESGLMQLRYQSSKWQSLVADYQLKVERENKGRN